VIPVEKNITHSDGNYFIIVQNAMLDKPYDISPTYQIDKYVVLFALNIC
jgi:hypothetical protein